MEEIRDRYLGKLMPFFTMVTQNSVHYYSALGRYPCRQRKYGLLCWLPQNVWLLNELVNQRSSDAWTLFDINFQLSKVGLLELRKKMPISVSMVLACAKCLDGRQNTLLNPGSISLPRGTIRECLYAQWRLYQLF